MPDTLSSALQDTRQSLQRNAEDIVLRDSDASWSKVPYQVRFGDSFNSMLDVLKYMSEVYGEDLKGYGGPAASANRLSCSSSSDFGVPEYFGRPYFKDTRLGMNDAINCQWQFNCDDDIVHPLMRSADSNLDIGEGRVYSSTTEQNQAIAWFTFGVPRFTGVTEFYKAAVNADLAKVNNTGFSDNSDFKLGKLVGEIIGLIAFFIPSWIITNFVSLIVRFKSYDVNRYYQLRPTMHLYYSYVDSILASWLVNTGLYGNGRDTEGRETSWFANVGSAGVPIVLQKNMSIWDVLKRKCTQKMTGMSNYGDELALIQMNESLNRDIRDIANDLIHIDNPAEGYDFTSEDASVDPDAAVWSGEGWNELSEDSTGMITRTALGATQFVGFRIEKSVDASESFSNSTQPSQLAEQLNSVNQQIAQKKFDFGFADSGVNTGIDLLDSALSGLATAVDRVSQAVGIDDVIQTFAGSAFIDVPEQYAGSEFGKSHSLSFQLRSPYGDMISIYQSIIVPLAMILAGALPRSAGPNSYSQPFLCRVYSKGLFSIPLGIIESVSIKRGSSEFGWTYNNLPTCVDVNISIKDLSPVMYIGMKAGAGDLFTLTGNPTTFDEYLLTLAGVGLYDRVSRFSEIRRRKQLFFHTLRNKYGNINYWKHYIGDSTILSFITAFSSGNYIPTK